MWAQLEKILPVQDAINIVGPMGVDPAMVNKDILTFWVDGGLNHKIGCKNSYWIGDGDSLKSSPPKKRSHLLARDKDRNDLGELLHRLEEVTLNRKLSIFSYGLLKGRDDHFLANLGEIMNFLSKGQENIKEFLIHHKNPKEMIHAFPAGLHELELQGSFTLFSLFHAQFTLTGECRYQLKKKTPLYPLSSHGLSNHGTGKVKITSDQAFMILSY